MKRFCFFTATVLIVALLCGCTVQVHFAHLPSLSEGKPPSLAAQEGTSVTRATSFERTQSAFDEVRAVWVSYTELNPKRLTSKAGFRRHVQSLLSPMQTLSVTDVFLQVRPFADAIYPSKLFASSSSVVRKRGDALPFDFLAVFLSQAKRCGLRVHAWINPYRVSTSTSDLSAFSDDPAVGPLLKNGASPCVLSWNGGVYLDPGSDAVQKLILDGAKELLKNYDLAGIHIDDYFYPTDDPSFDEKSFAAYLAAGEKDLLSYRRANVSRLVQGLYAAVKSFGSEKIFSISPSADIEKNEKVYAADVRLWGSADGYCDWLIPQIYFGFSHETRPFEDCAKAWQALCSGKNVRLLGGLAAYKIGKHDPFAGAGGAEWQTNAAVLSDQVRTLRRFGYAGFALFSATFLNFEQKVSAKVLKNLKDVI